MANFQDGIIRDGIGIGNGETLGNTKNGVIYKGTSLTAGDGDQIGNVRDFMIEEMEDRSEAEIVACYHFLLEDVF